ncbi:LysE family transporter [Vibrio sp. JC009]|uniref:LysE family translocator n=1 Tax=Vibrio sp. JC009 TaxID=2912314 RepID=UPI0023B01A0B|nr:LysE family transporter [Vibrio sp. JC009]WED23721.1 LysE family transporter [Vibrio sp. JC009]
MLVSTLFPVAFPALALAHFVALLSPGQDFFLIVAHSIRHRLKGSRYICLGVALGNAVYIAVAILGWTSIRDNPVIFSVVEVMGAIYLLWIGSRLLKSQKSEGIPTAEQAKIPSVTKQLLLGINSALLNPKNALFYMSLMTVILGSEVTLTQQMACGVWMFFAVLLWDLLVAALIGQPNVQSYLQRSIHIIERGAGVVLIVFGVGLFV